MIFIWGSKAKEIVTPGGNFLCPRCLSDAPYYRVRVAKMFTAFFAPLFETRTLGEYIRCGRCKAALAPDVLNLSRTDVLKMFGPWTCQDCGNQNPGSVGVCARCGKSRLSAPPPIPTAPPSFDPSRPVPPPPPPGSTSPPPTPQPAAGNSKKVIGCVVAAVAVFVVGIIFVFGTLFMIGKNASLRPKAPGDDELTTATGNITRHRNKQLLNTIPQGRDPLLGNNSEAVRLAEELSDVLGRDRLVATKARKGATPPQAESTFLVYCRLNEDSCAFLVYIPGLAYYEPDAADHMGQVAYTEADRLVDSANRPSIQKLAVAIRSEFRYEQLLIGPYQWHAQTRSEPPQKFKVGLQNPVELLPFFTKEKPATPVASPAATPAAEK